MDKSWKNGGIVKSQPKHILLESAFAIQIEWSPDTSISHFSERQELEEQHEAKFRTFGGHRTILFFCT